MFDLSEEQTMIISSLEDIVDKELSDNAFEWNGDPPGKASKRSQTKAFLG